jgi:UDP-N-acetylglucosamine 4,6-dehydratase
LIHEDEARTSVELQDMYVVQPTAAMWFAREWENQGRPLPDGFRYTSDSNPFKLSLAQIQEYVQLAGHETNGASLK